MRLRRTDDTRLGIGAGGAATQLAQEVAPLEGQLTARHDHSRVTAATRQLPAIEPIPAPLGLGVHARQIRVDRGDRGASFAEAYQLRMVTVAASATRQH